MHVLGTRFGSLELKIGSLESEKVITGSLESEKIGSLQVHTGYLTFSLKKLNLVKLEPCGFSQKFLLCNGVPCVHAEICSGIISLIILPVNSMATQLQKLWTFYYIPTHYSSVLFRSLHYYRPV